MTKKDYIIIAECLAYCKPSRTARPDGFDYRLGQWSNVVNELSIGLKNNNVRFNQDKFNKACGIEQHGDK
jgi:hypothetical protein